MSDSAPERGGAAGVGLFAIAIFSAAFLIFGVQPMVGKHILPWFGGAPGVWLACLAFYQTSLFVGYAYAYALIAKVPPARQPLIHTLLFAVAWFGLPVLPADVWKPDGADAASGRIFAMLIANVALPFVWLASTGPLVQAWFARAYPGRSPYPLYSVSNLGSLLALVTYPFLVEPQLALSLQASLFSTAFLCSGLVVVGCAWWAAAVGAARRTAVGVPAEPSATVRGDTAEDDRSRVTPGRRVFWVALPGSAVVLFMGVTNQLCLDVASVPFLWILPLSLYLVTLILCFASERCYPRTFCIAAALVFLAAQLLLAPGGVGATSGASWFGSIFGQIFAHCVLLFFGCMVAHGELHRQRPAASELTSFYLHVAAGGALGGLFVGIAAPVLFDGYFELPIGVALCALLTAAALRAQPTGVFAGAQRRFAWGAVLAAAALVTGVYLVHAARPEPNTVAVRRGFFGILRVLEGGRAAGDPWTLLRNGTTRHGLQYRREGRRGIATTYYARSTGLGAALETLQAERPRLEVGVVGLGVGTIAAYGRDGDRIVFYEIDPEVVRIAQNPRYFTYLDESAAAIEVVLGDARLSLEAESESALSPDSGRGSASAYDLLVLDAFSSDAVPTHLLTREAFAVYLQHLAADGVLAFHITNRHVDLAPLVFGLGFEAGLAGVRVQDLNKSGGALGGSDWVLLARNSDALERIATRARGGRDGSRDRGAVHVGWPNPLLISEFPVWTDDYSDIFSVLQRSRAQAPGD